MRILTISLAVTATMIITSCSHTALLSTWHDVDEPAHTFDKLAIIALAESRVNRGSMENAMVKVFSEYGINAVSTMNIFPNPTEFEGQNVDREAVEKEFKEKIEANGIDGIILIALLNVEEDEYYVEGSTQYVSGGYGGYPYRYPMHTNPYYGYNYYNYYSNYAVQVSTPGYYVNTTSYYVETSLFDVVPEKLLWTAQTKTTDPVSIDKERETFSNLIISQMIAEGVIEVN
jgi:hypothetical protein